MARPRNAVETVQITISTNPLNKEFLETLVRHGNFGKNAAEAAERLVSSKIYEFREGGGPVAESLRQTWLDYEARGEGDADTAP